MIGDTEDSKEPYIKRSLRFAKSIRVCFRVVSRAALRRGGVWDDRGIRSGRDRSECLNLTAAYPSINT